LYKKFQNLYKAGYSDDGKGIILKRIIPLTKQYLKNPFFSNFCLLTGGECPHYPISVIPNSFFLAEPYDSERIEREDAIKKALKGFELQIADEHAMNIAITCKICQQIQKSQYGIVDITNLNENVLIELGMLYGFKKPVLILVKSIKNIYLNR